MNQSPNYLRWQLAAIFTTSAFLLLNFLSGVIVNPNTVDHPIIFRDIGAALALPTIAGFGFFALPILIAKAHQAILTTAASTSTPIDVANQYASQIIAMPKKHILPSLALSVVIMFFYFHTEGLFYLEEIGFDANLRRFPLILQAVYMWTSIIMGIGIIFRITALVAHFIEQHLKVELFSAEELFPIANTVFWNILFFAFGLSLVPLFSLGKAPEMKDFLLAMIVFFILVNLMFYPLLRVRNIIVAKKAEALESYRQSRNHSTRKTQANAVGFQELGLSEAHKLRSSNLKQEIVSAREWPVSLHLAIRFCFLLLLPAASWLGMGLLKWIVERL